MDVITEGRTRNHRGVLAQSISREQAATRNSMVGVSNTGRLEMKLADIIDGLEREGFTTISYRPDKRCIYSVCRQVTSGGGVTNVSPGLYANELRIWWQGYLEGLRVKLAEFADLHTKIIGGLDNVKLD